MAGDIKELIPLTDLKQPILISAFTSAQKGGSTATSALAYLMSQWDAKLVAELDSDDYYNYARIRPMVRMDGDNRVIDWPTNVLYRMTPPEAERDVLVLVGIEPSMRWRKFAAELADYIEQLGVTQVISLRSVPAPVSHRLPTPIQAAYSNPAASESFGVAPTVFTEGPLDVAALLSIEMQGRGVETVDLIALEPYYTVPMPDMQAGLALLEAVGKAYALAIPAEALRPAIEAQIAAIEGAVASSEDVRAVVDAIEERTRAIQAQTEHRQLALPASEEQRPTVEINAEDALKEVEALLFGKGNGA